MIEAVLRRRAEDASSSCVTSSVTDCRGKRADIKHKPVVLPLISKCQDCIEYNIMFFFYHKTYTLKCVYTKAHIPLKNCWLPNAMKLTQTI